MQNKNYEIYTALLLPSALGAVVCTFFAGLIIFLHQFSFLQHYLQLPDSVNFARIILHWVDQNVNSLLGQGRTQAIVVGLFWAVVGLVVYFCLRGLAHFISDLSDGLDQRRYLWPHGANRNHAVQEAVTKGIFRFVAFLALLVVVLVLLPHEISGPVGVTWAKPLQYLLWFVVLWLTLHLGVVLVRLVALRPRLFS